MILNYVKEGLHLKRALIAAVLTLCLSVFCLPQVAFAEAKAIDYQNYSNWAYPELEKAEAVGLMTNRIRGDMKANVTREEFAELMANLGECFYDLSSLVLDPGTFTDTQNPRVLLAYEMAVVNGVGDGKFNPNANATREQIAAMLGRAVLVLAPDADTRYDEITMYTDQNQITPYALPFVLYLSQYEVIGGMNDGRFAPKAPCTREQAVALIVRLYEALGGTVPEIATPSTQVNQSIVGSWSSDGPNVDYFDAYGKLIQSAYSGTYYQFNADGSFKYMIGGSGPVVSGIILRQGKYTVSGNTIALIGVKESWQPFGSNQQAAYSGKSVSNVRLMFAFEPDGRLTLTEDDDIGIEKTFYRINK